MTLVHQEDWANFSGAVSFIPCLARSPRTGTLMKMKKKKSPASPGPPNQKLCACGRRIPFRMKTSSGVRVRVCGLEEAEDKEKKRKRKRKRKKEKETSPDPSYSLFFTVENSKNESPLITLHGRYRVHDRPCACKRSSCVPRYVRIASLISFPYSHVCSLLLRLARSTFTAMFQIIVKR